LLAIVCCTTGDRTGAASGHCQALPATSIGKACANPQQDLLGGLRERYTSAQVDAFVDALRLLDRLFMGRTVEPGRALTTSPAMRPKEPWRGILVRLCIGLEAATISSPISIKRCAQPLDLTRPCAASNDFLAVPIFLLSVSRLSCSLAFGQGDLGLHGPPL